MFILNVLLFICMIEDYCQTLRHILDRISILVFQINKLSGKYSYVCKA